MVLAWIFLVDRLLQPQELGSVGQVVQDQEHRWFLGVDAELGERGHLERYERGSSPHPTRSFRVEDTYCLKPSVFNGPEISMPRDNIHYGGWEHRDVHNINGMLFVCIPLDPPSFTHPLYQANQTYNALYHRSDPPKRPFVLTRAYYAGTQRFAAMWTGDNLGTWEHMAVGVKMVLSNSLGGMVFAGCELTCPFLYGWDF